MKRLADILLSLAALLLLAACTDDADVYNTPATSEGNLCVYVPVTREGDAITSSLSSSNPTYNASVEECQINDLHLYAFPVGVEGTFLSQELLAPQANEMINEKVARYQLQIKPGTYHVYVVANMEDVLKVKTINTEADLKNVVLSYNPNNPMSTTGMPVAGKIPMIYEPKAADGTTTSVIIKKKDTTPQTVVANMRFTCVKVCLNLVYDPNAEGVSSALKNGMIINDVKAERLSPSTNLLWDGKFSNPSVSSDYAKGFGSTLYDLASATGTGAYYSDWTEDLTHLNENNNNIITVNGTGVANLDQVGAKQKWLFRATYYLPERYVAKADQQSALKIGGTVGGHNNSYNINLGHRQDESSTTEIPTFPRGTYYEIVGRIKSLGNIDLDCVVGVKDWEPAEVDADMYHTALWVSKSEAEVTSLTSDSIFYTTNWIDGVEFGCDTQVDGKDVIVKTENVVVNNKIIFHINRNIPVSKFTSTEGTAKVWLKVNNLKKYINVKYNVTPYFFVRPKDVVIYWGADPDGVTTYTKIFDIETNLGGYRLCNLSNNELLNNAESNIGQSKIQFAVDNEATIGKDGFYQLKVTATTDPGTTTMHHFVLKPFESNAKVSNQDITVTVKPSFGDYRIYMRAINDMVSGGKKVEKEKYEHHNGDIYIFTTDEYNEEELRDESYDTSHDGATNPNWYDGWAADNDWTFGKDNWSEKPSSKNHRMYMYTQIGETSGNTVNKEVWAFATWPGHEMTPDYNNPGWYYKIMSKDLKGTPNNEAQGKGDKYITPGQTLIIFSNNTNNNGGSYTIHRFTHHMEPGISLFNYEDREGWYLYDPTSEPVYQVYDDKPVVVDVDYTIYTKRKIIGWYHIYGVNDPMEPSDKEEYKNVILQFIAYYNSSAHSHKKYFKSDQVSGGWWKTVIRFKAVRGEYDKAIRLKFDGYADDSNHQPVLFGGDNFKSTGRNGNAVVVEGWTDSDLTSATWHRGKPSGI